MRNDIRLPPLPKVKQLWISRKDEIKRMCFKDNLSLSEIAEHYGVSVKNMRYWLDNLHINYKPEYTEPQQLWLNRKDEVIELYWEKGLTVKELAKHYETSETNLRFWLNFLAIPRRNASTRRINALERSRVPEHSHNIFNYHFFDNWSPSMAWVLGLIFSDGYMSNRGEVRLALKDKELIDKVAKVVGHEVIKSAPQSYDKNNYIHSITLTNAHTTKILKNLGVTPKKSLIIKFPKEIPSDCMRHFIRGFFDGDGGASVTPKGKVTAHITTGSEVFMNQLSEILFNEGVVRVQLRKDDPHHHQLRQKYGNGPYPLRIYKRKNAKAYDIRIGHPEAVRKFYDYMYQDVPESEYLSRKHDIMRKSLR